MSEFFQIFCKFISLYIWYVYNEIGKTLLIKKRQERPANRTTAARTPQPNKKENDRLPCSRRKQSQRNKPTTHVTREAKRRQTVHAIERRNPVRKVARQGKNNLSYSTRRAVQD
jgi:hypothetical protein